MPRGSITVVDVSGADIGTLTHTLLVLYRRPTAFHLCGISIVPSFVKVAMPGLLRKPSSQPLN